MSQIKVLYAIQARSTSKRFPRKIFEMIGKDRVLDHVVQRARSSANHVSRYNDSYEISARVALLIPYADKELYNNFRYSDCIIIEGPEDDVLARFVEAQRVTGADYIVRLTSDCPLLLDYMLSKHVNVAIRNRYDYVSNVEESCRTIADGFDCEVLSAAALSWLNDNSQGLDREHVTTAIRKLRPKDLKQAIIMSQLDTSGMKMSLDTEADRDRIRRYFHELELKTENAERLFGHSVYWI